MLSRLVIGRATERVEKFYFWSKDLVDEIITLEVLRRNHCHEMLFSASRKSDFDALPSPY